MGIFDRKRSNPAPTSHRADVRPAEAGTSAFDAPTAVIDDITGDYTLDASHSRIGFSARHAMVTTVRGSFSDFEGAARTVEARLPDAIEATRSSPPSGGGPMSAALPRPRFSETTFLVQYYADALREIGRFEAMRRRVAGR